MAFSASLDSQDPGAYCLCFSKLILWPSGSRFGWPDYRIIQKCCTLGSPTIKNALFIRAFFVQRLGLLARTGFGGVGAALDQYYEITAFYVVSKLARSEIEEIQASKSFNKPSEIA